jgi:L-fucose/D-arabinose isomerase
MALRPDQLKSIPKIGVIGLVDPRVPQATRQEILSRHAYRGKLASLGIEVIGGEDLLESEEQVIEQLHRLRGEEVAGLILYTAWFLRSNTIARAALDCHVPVLVWTQPDEKTAALVGLGVAHGALEEIGFPHKVLCGRWDPATQREISVWAHACHVKSCMARSRYGQWGVRCLSMLPADTDSNQWRWKFGIDVQQEEQWTLIHRAQRVPDSPARALVDRWSKEFKQVEASGESMLRSAKLYIAGKEFIEEFQWTFVGVKCQFELIDNYVSPCLPISLWNDEGIVASCESDMNAALTMFSLYGFSKRPSMFADVSDVDFDEGVVRFLNCGTAATDLAGGKQNVKLTECPKFQGTSDKETGEPLCKGGACTHFVMEPGRITLARFGRIKGEYVLYVCGGEAVKYPKHDPEAILGAGALWPWAYVRPDEPLRDFIRHLRAHHICVAKGDWVTELKELALLLDVRVLD